MYDHRPLLAAEPRRMGEQEQSANERERTPQVAKQQQDHVLPSSESLAVDMLANLTSASGRLAVLHLAMAHAEQRGTNKIIMPLFSNVKFLPFLRNLICSIERLAVRSWLTIGLDNRTCAALQGSGRCVHPYHDAASVTLTEQRSVFGSATFFQLALQRPLWVHHLLWQGFSVLNCDSDIVWLHNPLPMLASMRAHLIVQSDTGHGLNSGFYLAKPSATCKSFFAAWLADLSKRSAGSAPANEQDSMNSVLRHTISGAQVRPHVLNETLFPNGKMWWEWGKSDKKTAFIVHCNWVRQGKKTRLARDNLWFLDDDDEHCARDFHPSRDGCDRRCLPYQHCEVGVHDGCKRITNCDALRAWHSMARVAANCTLAHVGVMR